MQLYPVQTLVIFCSKTKIVASKDEIFLTSWSDIRTEVSLSCSPTHHQLATPHIKIQRPSSAPPSRTDSSPSLVGSSRPSSARLSQRPRTSTENVSSPGGVSTPYRQRSVSSAGQGKEWKGRPLPVYGGSKTLVSSQIRDLKWLILCSQYNCVTHPMGSKLTDQSLSVKNSFETLVKCLKSICNFCF